MSAFITSPAGTVNHAKLTEAADSMKNVMRMEQDIKEMEARADQMYKDVDKAKNESMVLVRDLNQYERFHLMTNYFMYKKTFYVNEINYLL
jgi:hypothetical protein